MNGYVRTSIKGYEGTHWVGRGGGGVTDETKERVRQ
jgi:hypothetical protein